MEQRVWSQGRREREMNERSERRFPTGFDVREDVRSRMNSEHPTPNETRRCEPPARAGAYSTAKPVKNWRSTPERRILSGFVLERGSFVHQAAWKAALRLALLVFCVPVLGYQGSGESSLFTVDTRWNYSEGSASGLFRIDTRLSGSAGDAASGTFTVDTTGASVGTAIIAGYIRDANGAFLPGATVSALRSSVVRAQVFTDASGYFQLTSLPSGTYQLRVEKPVYLSGIRYGVSVATGETVIQNFTLAAKPAAPTTTPVSRAPPVSTLVPVTGTQLKVFANGAFTTNASIDRTKRPWCSLTALTVIRRNGRRAWPRTCPPA